MGDGVSVVGADSDIYTLMTVLRGTNSLLVAREELSGKGVPIRFSVFLLAEARP